MKLLANYKNKTITKDGKINLMFQVEGANLSTVESLENTLYQVEIKKPYRKRSLEQNAYLWALIGEICLVENGDTIDKEDTYLRLLEMSGAKSITLTMKTEAIPMLKKSVKHIKVLQEVMYHHTPYSVVEVYQGSSTFDTKEMTNLIETTLKYASEIGIETEYWKELLNV